MPSGLEMIDGQTSPPNLLTEADLISLMDKHGIGTIHFIYKVYELVLYISYYCYYFLIFNLF